MSRRPPQLISFASTFIVNHRHFSPYRTRSVSSPPGVLREQARGTAALQHELCVCDTLPMCTMASTVEEEVEAYKKRTNTGDYVFVRVRDIGAEAAPAPTVVLFGWFGASPKHVSKYASRWESLGYSTMVVVAPTSVVFSLNMRNVPTFLLSVLSIVAADKRLHAGGLVMQFFSNGGAYCAPVLSAMFAGGLREKIPADKEAALRTVQGALAAVVFDSAPAYMHLEAGVNAFIKGLGVPEESVLARFLRLVFVTFAWLQRVLYGDVAARYWQAVRNANYGCPELYMYSRNDPLADAAHIEALVREREEKFKGRVHEFCVENAPHVKLMVKYPSEYMQRLAEVERWGVDPWRQQQGLQEWKAT